MIRDDFNLPAGRFMNAMDLRVVQGENYAVIDLFDVPHATRVLIRFGQALGHLPETGELSGEQRTFVDRVIESLQVRGELFRCSCRFSPICSAIALEPEDA